MLVSKSGDKTLQKIVAALRYSNNFLKIGSVLLFLVFASAAIILFAYSQAVLSPVFLLIPLAEATLWSALYMSRRLYKALLHFVRLEKLPRTLFLWLMIGAAATLSFFYAPILLSVSIVAANQLAFHIVNALILSSVVALLTRALIKSVSAWFYRRGGYIHPSSLDNYDRDVSREFERQKQQNLTPTASVPEYHFHEENYKTVMNYMARYTESVSNGHAYVNVPLTYCGARHDLIKQMRRLVQSAQIGAFVMKIRRVTYHEVAEDKEHFKFTSEYGTVDYLKLYQQGQANSRSQSSDLGDSAAVDAEDKKYLQPEGSIYQFFSDIRKILVCEVSTFSYKALACDDESKREKQMPLGFRLRFRLIDQAQQSVTFFAPSNKPDTVAGRTLSEAMIDDYQTCKAAAAIRH